MVSSAWDLNFKILLLGDSQVGKSCFLLRYVKDTFTDNFINTIGVDYKIKFLSLNDKIVKLHVWDTAGQDRFRCITKNYFRGSDGIFLLYDVTNLNSFNNIRNWIIQIRDHLGDSACIILAGNKIDLESNRKVSKEEAMRFAADNKLLFFEVSAKENINLSEAFLSLTKEMINKSTSTIKKSVQNILNQKKENKKNCCK